MPLYLHMPYVKQHAFESEQAAEQSRSGLDLLPLHL